MPTGKLDHENILISRDSKNVAKQQLSSHTSLVSVSLCMEMLTYYVDSFVIRAVQNGSHFNP